MTAKDAIKHTLDFCREVTHHYLSDLNDADLLVRPVPQANHPAWQLGHVIVSEREMMAGLGHTMPPLPADFAAAYTKETSASNDPAKFAHKQVYLDLMSTIRAGTLKALDATPEADLDKPAPESMRAHAPTIGAVTSG